jgi:hypothetical protein
LDLSCSKNTCLKTKNVKKSFEKNCFKTMFF